MRKASSILLFTFDAHMDASAMSAVDEACEQMGLARADGYRLAFTPDGHANVKPEEGGVVWGVLWVVPATAMVMLDAWARNRGLERGVMFIVCPAGPRVPATAYFAPGAEAGDPKAEEVEAIVQAARRAKIEPRYLANLEAFRKVSR